MAQPTYEEQRAVIEKECRKKRRTALWLTVGGILLVAAAFVVGVIVKAEWVGFFAAGALILMGFIAKIGGEAMKNANIMERHRLQLLDENTPTSRMRWD